MNPRRALSILLAEGKPLDRRSVHTSLTNSFELAEREGGLWTEVCFILAFIYGGCSRQLCLFSEGWYTLPPTASDSDQL